MFCTQCGASIVPDSRFCSACGLPVNSSVYSETQHASLVRPLRRKRIAGVCAAFADYLQWDVTLIRILWLAAILGFGTGLIAYIIAWIVIPGEREELRVIRSS